MYSVDWDKLINDNLCGILQKPALIGLIKALQKPLRQDHALFTSFKQQTDNKIMHDGRVYLLRKRLNDQFDNELRRITIIDEIIPEDHYIGNKQNVDQSYIVANSYTTANFHIGNSPMYFANHDFIVNVPTLLISKDAMIRSEINHFKFAGKTYELNYFKP